MSAPSLAEVFERLYGVQLTRNEGQTMCVCPFHDDKNPSMSVNLGRGVYNCKAASCGAKGSVYHALLHAWKPNRIALDDTPLLDPGQGGVLSEEEWAEFTQWINDQGWTTAAPPSRRRQATTLLYPDWYRSKTVRELAHSNLRKWQRSLHSTTLNGRRPDEILEAEHGISGHIARKFGVGYTGTKNQYIDESGELISWETGGSRWMDERFAIPHWTPGFNPITHEPMRRSPVLLGVKLRTMPRSSWKDSRTKYMSYPGGHTPLFNARVLHPSNPNKSYLLIFESEWEVLTAASMGLDNAISAPASKTLPDWDNLQKLYIQFGTVFVVPNNDEEGQGQEAGRARAELLKTAGADVVIATPTQTKDFHELALADWQYAERQMRALVG